MLYKTIKCPNCPQFWMSKVPFSGLHGCGNCGSSYSEEECQLTTIRNPNWAEVMQNFGWSPEDPDDPLKFRRSLITPTGAERPPKYAVQCCLKPLEKRYAPVRVSVKPDGTLSWVGELVDLSKFISLKMTWRHPETGLDLSTLVNQLWGKQRANTHPVKVPVRKVKIPAAMRRIVWENHANEQGATKCYCCEVFVITPFNFECGHIVSEAKGGATVPSNLRPICSVCNRSMGTHNMEDFKVKLRS